MEKVPPAPPAAAAPRPCGAGARARRMRTPQHFPGAGEVSTLGFRGQGPSRRAVGPPRLQREQSGVRPDFETLIGTAGGHEPGATSRLPQGACGRGWPKVGSS